MHFVLVLVATITLKKQKGQQTLKFAVLYFFSDNF